MYRNKIKGVVLQDLGTTYSLDINDNSGKIIYRNKIDSIIGIKHPGIILGNDQWGTVWVIHNHYKIGKPQIVTLDQFAEDQEVFYDLRPVFYSKEQIVKNAIEHWNSGREYSWLRYNCQQFVNGVTQGKRYSETVDRVSENLMLVGAFTSLLGLVSKNGTLVKAGLLIGGAGVTSKVLSRA
jgi:hypothetical protein